MRRHESRLQIVRLSLAFQEFLHSEAHGGILLLLATAVALLWANSPWGSGYRALWETKLTLGAGGHGLTESLAHWINDGLMVVFFLVVGLEIKREVLTGELASARRAALPVAAAVGGAVAPALIYLMLNRGTEAARGWGVPMATDIAFALGALALLGSRAPSGLKVFLTALAIVDDLIAVLVIALFYTSDISWPSLLVAGGLLLLLVAANRAGLTHLLVYGLLGAGLWLAFWKSGVHATIAGVLLALTIPGGPRPDGPASEREPPLRRVEHALHPWAAYGIVPLFALANAGIPLGGDASGGLTDTVALGVVAGLVVGKQLGIMLATRLIVRCGLADLPRGVDWRHVYGAAWLAGIGFTMALFIADLAFDDAAQLTTAKLGILTASTVAGVGGYTILRLLPAAEAPERDGA